MIIGSIVEWGHVIFELGFEKSKVSVQVEKDFIHLKKKIPPYGRD